MIVSAIEGRMRIVDPALRDKQKADAIETHLRRLAVVESAKTNPLTGSLLVFYDSSAKGSRIVRNAVHCQLKVLKPRGNAGPLTGKGARKNVKLAMLGAITASIGLLLAGSEKWHFRLGTVFLSSLSLHLYQNRKRIFK